MRKIFTMFMLTLFSFVANAEESQNVCVSYYRSASYPQWSTVYQVRANILSGNELSSKVGCISCFPFLDYYAVIWWDVGEVTVLHLGNNHFITLNTLKYYDTVDLQGRSWKIAGGEYGCPILPGAAPY